MKRKVTVQEIVAVAACAMGVISLCMGEKEIALAALGGMLALLRSNSAPVQEPGGTNA